ncbi:hypothetical protein K1719_025091 [Acacia pycnantha]|nr:hypothetical protein K1719_025091 [Acacia pycnantha]
MSNARSSEINVISTRLNCRLSHLDFDSKEGEVRAIVDDVHYLLKLKKAKVETLRVAREDIEKKYGDMTAETEKLKRKIRAVKRKIEKEEAEEASLLKEAKRLKLDKAITKLLQKHLLRVAFSLPILVQTTSVLSLT